MRAHVLSQVAGRRERLASQLAYMRLLPRMPLHVLNQLTGLSERLAARLTDVRLLPRMRAHVLSQLAGLGERRATCLALKAPSARVPRVVGHLALMPRPAASSSFRCAAVSRVVGPLALVPRTAARSSFQCAPFFSMLIHIFPPPHDPSLYL